MVPTTEDTEIVISLPSPIPKEEELLSTTDISTTDFCPIDENNSSSYPNSNRTSLISQASTVSRDDTLLCLLSILLFNLKKEKKQSQH